MSATYPFRYNFDAQMIQLAAGRAAWRDCPASIRPTVLAQLTNTAVMALRGAA